jgi:hypothetical protein
MYLHISNLCIVTIYLTVSRNRWRMQAYHVWLCLIDWSWFPDFRFQNGDSYFRQRNKNAINDCHVEDVLCSLYLHTNSGVITRKEVDWIQYIIPLNGKYCIFSDFLKDIPLFATVNLQVLKSIVLLLQYRYCSRFQDKPTTIQLPCVVNYVEDAWRIRRRYFHTWFVLPPIKLTARVMTIIIKVQDSLEPLELHPLYTKYYLLAHGGILISLQQQQAHCVPQ